MRRTERTHEERHALARAYSALDHATLNSAGTDTWKILNQAREAVVKELYEALTAPVMLETLLANVHDAGQVHGIMKERRSN